MRCFAACLALFLLLTGCAQTHPETRSNSRTDAESAAYKAGKVAHAAAVKTEKAAKIVGEKLKNAASSAEQGWKDSKPK